MPEMFNLQGSVDAIGGFFSTNLGMILLLLFIIGIVFVVIILLWYTKYYKRIIHRWPIHVLYFDQRKGSPILCSDKMRLVSEADGLEKAELLHKNENIEFPSLSHIIKTNKGGNVYFLQRMETGIWIPVKIDLANPDPKIITELKDMKFALNMKKIMDRETRTRWAGKSWMERYGWLLMPMAIGICFLLIAYATWTYWLQPLYSGSQAIASQNLEATKALTDAIKAEHGITESTPAPVNITPPR